jgi:CRP/FNR family transcriptional regulator, cyclic AMP receptor protein
VGRVRVLECDRDLGAFLEPSSFQRACMTCTAELISARPGPVWPPEVDPREQAGHAGFLLLSGTLLHRLRLAGRNTVELLGPGDVVRPWPAPDDFGDLLNPGRWELLGEVALAGLDRVFGQQASAWPGLSAALAQRRERRLRSVLLRLAAAQIPALETRLRVVLWDLADRFGRVDRDGVLLPLRLHHDVLAGLTCASRESVGRALGALAQHGAVRRDPLGWRLAEGPPPELFADDEPQSPPRHAHPRQGRA